MPFTLTRAVTAPAAVTRKKDALAHLRQKAWAAQARMASRPAQETTGLLKEAKAHLSPCDAPEVLSR